jgi:hypothetical protein
LHVQSNQNIIVINIFLKEAPLLGKFHCSFDDVSSTLRMIAQSNQLLNNGTFQMMESIPKEN